MVGNEQEIRCLNAWIAGRSYLDFRLKMCRHINRIFAKTMVISRKGFLSTEALNIPEQSRNNYCGNVETVLGDDNVWKDVTSTSCDTAADECRYMDKISGLEWSEYLGQSVWGSAVQSCENLMNDGQSDWRLPTQKEIMDAYNHGNTSVGNASWIPIELMDD